MNKQKLNELVVAYRKDLESLKNYVKEYVQNKDNSLDDRWDIFVESEVGDRSEFYINFDGIDWNRYTLYDDFYCDKHQTIDVLHMLDILSDGEIEFDEVLFKEDVLKQFIYSFKNYW